MRKLLLLLTGVIFLCLQMSAQQRTITGKVTDDKGVPIQGASVLISGTKNGTTTDASGAFSITAPSGAKNLVISIVGYEEKLLSIVNQLSVTVSLSTADKKLDEVVVTAYGATKRKAYTGTASTINADKFKDLQVTSITGVLQGNASGVLAVNSTGQPGENPTIRIRGVGSINASSDPLIILDGAQYGGNINGINPADIESITVLKDASSTALYGNRAANGVLVITTKSGKGAPRVSVSAITGFAKRAVNDYSYVNPAQMYELSWEALRNEAIINPTLVTSTGSASPEEYASKTVAGKLVYNPFGVAQPVGTDGKIVANAKNLWNENWSDVLLQTGVRKDFNLSVAGGSEKTKYYISGGYLDDKSIVAESRFKRYTGRLKLDTRVNDWFTVGINTNLAYSTQNYPNQAGGAFANVIGWIHQVSGIYPEYLRSPTTGDFILDSKGNKQFDYGNNGPLTRPIAPSSNPAGTTSQNPTSYDRFTTSISGYAEAQIIKGLKFRTQYALDFYQYGQNTYYNPFVGDGAAYNGRSLKSREQTTTQTFTNTFNYDKVFGGIHHINALAGMEAYRYHDGTVSTESRGFYFPGATELVYGTTPYSATSNAYDNRLASYFGRVNYDLNDKYHLSASLRRDGTSRFADSVRWGTFYSVGGAWNINKEDFLNGIRAITDLKLRASYGTAGNQLFTTGNGNLYFPYLGTYLTGANIAGYGGAVFTSIANGYLTWETQKTLDLGIDFGLFKNRVTGSFTYFTRTSDKLLLGRPLSPSLGISTINDNAGTVKNEGVEIDLTTINITNKDFEWSTSVNLTHIKNKITALPSTFAGANYSNLTVGQSLFNFYIREYVGVDKTDGRPVWFMDQTDPSSGKVTQVLTKTYSQATRYYKGTSLPDLTGGMTNTVRYKNFDLTVLVSFNIGGKIYDGDYGGMMYGSTGTGFGYTWVTDILGRWQSASNPGDGLTPKLTATTDYQGNSVSTRFLYDASYARVRNITVGYRLPRELLGKAKIASARFYVDLQNAFTIFGRKGLDPESGLAGVTNNASVVYKTISAGLNFDF